MNPRRTTSQDSDEPAVGRSTRAEGEVLVLDRNPRSAPRGAAAILGLHALMTFCLCAVSVAFIIHVPFPVSIGFFTFVLPIGLLSCYSSLRCLISRERLWIDSRGIRYARVDGLVRRRRIIPFPEIQRLVPYWVRLTDGDGKGSRFEFGLAIETIGRTFCVGQCRDPDAIERLHADLQSLLCEWHPAWWPYPAASWDREVLDASGMRAEPPSDSTMQCRRECDCIEFGRDPTRGSIAAIWPIPVALILGGLIVGPFLSPAKPVAIVLLGGLILAGLCPWHAERRRRWVVRPGEIRTSLPAPWGLFGSRTIEIEWLNWIELRRTRSPYPEGSSFHLAL